MEPKTNAAPEVNRGPKADRAPRPEVRWVKFEAVIPEPLAQLFRTLNPWQWRELRPVFCRHDEERRLRNIVRSLRTILEKIPHMLARGIWTVDGYIESRRKLGTLIASVGYHVNQMATAARLRLPVVPEERGEGARPAPAANRKSA